VTRTLWLRLDDVLPLAEHAVACPTHRITRAQVHAGMPLLPALIWDGSANTDTLSSNGVPVWHDEHGHLHTAAARTWRHVTTGRRGAAAQPRYDTAYLPLQHAPDGESTVDELRDGHRNGMHWVAINVDPSAGHVIGPASIRALACRDDLVPDGAAWAPATLTCPTVAGTAYPALVADGYTTDTGHEIARFDRPTVEQMITDLDAIHASPDRNSDPMPGEHPTLRMLHGGVVAVFDEYDDGLHAHWRETDCVHPDPDGWYSVGAYQWPWTLTTN
jgi:hypothetical protein